MPRPRVMLCFVLSMTPVVATADDDPFEGWNRGVLSFNDTADKYLLRPIATGYRFVVPDPVENSVHRFFDNLLSPTVVVNQLLQGKVGLAAEDTLRFLVNSTVGIGGLFDVATPWGLPAHEEDFGQTLAVWGVGPGPYLMLPLFGPSSPVDAIGLVGDNFLNPVGYLENVPVRNSLTGLQFVDLRVQLLSAEELISGDRYNFLRDAYLQRRVYLVNDGVVEDTFVDDEF